jgi:pimeloyl-ACP methyl ester carboxylesterase
MRRAGRWTVAIAAGLLCTAGWVRHEHRPAIARYHPRDAFLRSLPLYVYPAPAGSPPRALVVFLGNDVGFWRPHQRLAERLADHGFDVVGVDLIPVLRRLPADPAARAPRFSGVLTALVSRARAELRAGPAPLLLAGHSAGAEVALWAAAHALRGQAAGVLALSPGERGHLRITLGDRLGREPREAGSFAVADEAAEAPPSVRIALVRGVGDRLGRADAAIERAGGARLHRFAIPLAGHSLRSLVITGPVVEDAAEWLIARR